MPTCFLDSETHPIVHPGQLAPKIVCMQLWVDAVGEPLLLERERALPRMRALLETPDMVFVGVRIAYDFACLMATDPHLTPLIFQAYDDGRVIDLALRDKMLRLAWTGEVDYQAMPDGKAVKLWYNLGALAKRLLGVELDGKSQDDKEDLEASWRTQFGHLDGWKAEDYPADAADYALKDVLYLPQILIAQNELAAQHVSHYPELFCTLPLTVAADFALYLHSCWGVKIDSTEREKALKMLEEELTPERLEPLYAAGIIRRPIPTKPYANQRKRAEQLLQERGFTCDMAALQRDDWYQWASHPAFVEAGIKFTAPKKEQVDTKALKTLVRRLSAEAEVPIKITDKGLQTMSEEQRALTTEEELKYTSTADEVLIEILGYDDVLDAYHHRQKLQKLVTTELPRIMASRVHPSFDALKRTGRTSSYKPNTQNVDPRIRPCYVADPGFLFLSIDYSAIELVTLAQKLIRLFGSSTLAQQLHAGMDPHAALATRLASSLSGTWQGSYDDFVALKASEIEEERAFFKHWRTMAKPTGLGYPGGLGPKTFIAYAKGTFGVRVTLEEATRLRELWHEEYPEMRRYFSWVSDECQQPDGSYAYLSPMGMLRGRTTFTAAANGAALQTPASEGMKLATFALTRECLDFSQVSVLFGCHPWNSVHDQAILAIPNDHQIQARVDRASQIMMQEMSKICPDVPVRVEACLSERWYKEAEPVFDDRDQLMIWRPDAA